MQADWRTPEWTATGKKVRAAWQALPRLREWLTQHGLDGYPVRHDYPPRISSDKTAHSSPVERAAERLDRIEGEITVTRARVEAALDELRGQDFEAWMAVRGVDVDSRAVQQMADQLRCSPGRVYGLLNAGWAFIAWEIARDGA